MPRPNIVTSEVVRTLRLEISDMRRGQKFYSSREIAERFNVSQKTGASALRRLADYGLLICPDRVSGYFVR